MRIRGTIASGIGTGVLPKGRREGALAGSWCSASLEMDPSQGWWGPEHRPGCSHSCEEKLSLTLAVHISRSPHPSPSVAAAVPLQGEGSELPLGLLPGGRNIPTSPWDVQVAVGHSCRAFVPGIEQDPVKPWLPGLLEFLSAHHLLLVGSGKSSLALCQQPLRPTILDRNPSSLPGSWITRGGSARCPQNPACPEADLQPAGKTSLPVCGISPGFCKDRTVLGLSIPPASPWCVLGSSLLWGGQSGTL